MAETGNFSGCTLWTDAYISLLFLGTVSRKDPTSLWNGFTLEPTAKLFGLTPILPGCQTWGIFGVLASAQGKEILEASLLSGYDSFTPAASP